MNWKTVDLFYSLYPTTCCGSYMSSCLCLVPDSGHTEQWTGCTCGLCQTDNSLHIHESVPQSQSQREREAHTSFHPECCRRRDYFSSSPPYIVGGSCQKRKLLVSPKGLVTATVYWLGRGIMWSEAIMIYFSATTLTFQNRPAFEGIQ